MAVREELSRWIEELSELLHLHSKDGRRAFLLQAGMDDDICRAMNLEAPTTTFCPILIDTLLRYKTLQDGRDPVEALIQSVLSRLGPDHQPRGAELLQQVRAYRLNPAVQDAAQALRPDDPDVHAPQSHPTQTHQEGNRTGGVHIGGSGHNPNVTVKGNLIGGDQTVAGRDLVQGDLIKGDHVTGNKIEQHYYGEHTSPAEVKALQDAYLTWLLRKVGYVPLAEIDPKTAALEAETRLNLDAIYTALLTRGVEQGLSQFPDKEFRHRPRSTLTHLNQHKHAVLLGNPGSGKSTFVNFVVMCLAGELLGDSHANLRVLTAPLPKTEQDEENPSQVWEHGALLPIRVILRDFAARGLPPSAQPASAQHLWAFVAQELQDAELGEFVPFLKAHLRTQGGIILFDGLDEVPDIAQRRTQINQVIEECASVFCPCRVVVTSRIYAYQEDIWQFADFTEAVLAPFSPEHIRCFITRWYQYIAPLRGMLADEASGEASALSTDILRNPHLRELAERPLLLTLMASLHASRGKLPHKRVELYRETVELLLDRWERRKFERKDAQGHSIVEYRSLAAWLQVEKDSILNLLKKLAYEAHLTQPETDTRTADIPKDTLTLALLKISPDKDLPQKRLEEHLRDRAGLLVLSPHEGAYTFPHRSFQEYLAAAHVFEQDDYPDNLAAVACYQPNQWREVVLLAAALGPPRDVWALVDAFCQADVMDDSLSPGDAWGALLAGQAMVETLDLAQVAPRHAKKIHRVRDWLVAILTEQQPVETPFPAVERALAGTLLARVGDCRPGSGLHESGLLHIAWCDVPAGTFVMGSNPDNDTDALKSEQPQHAVQLSQFSISRYVVTNAQYQAFMKDGGYTERSYWTDMGWTWKEQARINAPERGRDTFHLVNHPVVGVSWYEAAAFCSWLTSRFREGGILSDNAVIRLPTEAEWERAARGEDGRIYPWGDNVITSEHANYEVNLGVTSAVGCFPRGASPYGCEDMAGNVWEWCLDWFDSEYYTKSPKKNPMGPDAGSDRVLRGGAWGGAAEGCRSADRGWCDPGGRVDYLGFRLLRT